MSNKSDYPLRNRVPLQTIPIVGNNPVLEKKKRSKSTSKVKTSVAVTLTQTNSNINELNLTTKPVKEKKPRSKSSSKATKSNATTKKPPSKLECHTLLINDANLNPHPALSSFIGQYGHYPTGKICGVPREDVKKSSS